MTKTKTASDTGWATGLELHPVEKAQKHQVELWVESHTGLARVFLTKKQAEKHLKRALAIIQQDSPYKLIRAKPDPGFSIAYKVFDKKGFQVGSIEREEDGSKCWWVCKGISDTQEGIGFSHRWAAVKHLESISGGDSG